MTNHSRPNCSHCIRVSDAVSKAWGESLKTGHIMSTLVPAECRSADYAALSIPDQSMHDCDCVCHIPARVAGALPRIPNR